MDELNTQAGDKLLKKGFDLAGLSALTEPS
jgi:hypothetical protein